MATTEKGPIHNETHLKIPKYQISKGSCTSNLTILLKGLETKEETHQKWVEGKT